MRNALNNNPLVQVAAIGLLGVFVAFLLLTRLSGDDPPPEEPAASSAVPGAPASPAPGAAAPATGEVAPGSTPDVIEPAPDAGEFVAGPGLPSKVVSAYAQGKSVVVLVTRFSGIDDQKLERIAKRVGQRSDIAFFPIRARDVADYSRLTQGVDLSRVPALIALSPRSVSGSGPPVAVVEYGFRGYNSIVQAVEDASYDGRELTYDPN